jgi:hypothetical protein
MSYELLGQLIMTAAFMMGSFSVGWYVGTLDRNEIKHE